MLILHPRQYNRLLNQQIHYSLHIIIPPAPISTHIYYIIYLIKYRDYFIRQGKGVIEGTNDIVIISQVICMSKVLLIALVMAGVLAQIPNCDILPGQDESRAVFMPDEVQVFQLQHFIEGFNLRFDVDSADKDTFQVINPFYASDRQDFPDTLGNDFTIIDFSMETDGSQAWIDRGAFLATKNADNSIFVASGHLNEKMNIQINNTVDIAVDGNTVCFNVIPLSINHLLVDCQMQDKQTDVVVIIDQATNNVTPYPFTNSTVTHQRKSVPLRVFGDGGRGNLEDGRVYIFSAWIGTGIDDQSQANNTIIEIYYLDGFTPYKFGRLGAQNFSVDDLSISDITVDATGSIYVSDIRGKVFQFTYEEETFDLLNTWTFDENIYKISAHVSNSLVSIIQAVGDTQIYEIDFDQYTSKFAYQLPVDNSTIIDLVTSHDLLILQTENFYYVYRRYFTQLDHIIAVFSSFNSRIVLTPRSINGIIVDVYGSESYIHSEGFFIVKNPKNNQTVTVTGTSPNFNGYPGKICQFSFQVQAVTDPTALYNIRDVPSIVSYMSTSVKLEYALNDYFLGSKLQYTVETESDVKLTLLTQDTVQVETNETYSNADWLGTFEDGYFTYYKVIVVDQKMIVQHCAAVQSEVVCVTTRTQDFSDTIFKHSFFRTKIDPKLSLPVIAYITENNKRSVNFLTLTGDRTFSPLVVDDTFNATDVDGNAEFLYVPIKEAKMIRFYKNSYNLTFNEVNTIDSSDVPSTDPDFIFYPSETMLSSQNLNILIVKNLDGILIFRANAFNVEFVSEISVPHLELSYVSSEIVVGAETMLLILSDNSTGVDDQIHQFSIYDLSNPFKLRSISLLDKQLSRPVTALTAPKSNLVGLKTNLDNTSYLSIIQMGRPQVGSLLADIPLQGNLLSLVTVAEYVIGETIPQRQTKNLGKQIENSVTVVRFYPDPVLIVQATLQNDDFKDTKSFKLTVTSIQRPQPMTQLINLYNVRSSIASSSKATQKIEFPRNSNGHVQEKLIDADSYFLGPIGSYSVNCPICTNPTVGRGDSNGSITLKDHVTLLHQAQFAKARAFYSFTDKNILWSITNSGIYVTDHNLNPSSYVDFNFDFISARVDGITPFNNKFLVYAYSQMNNVHNLVTVAADDKMNPIIESVIPIFNNPGINAVQIMKSLGNRVFILDNKLDTTGKGEIYVITFSNDDGGQKFTYEAVIDSSTFNLQSGKINDIQLIKVDNDNGFLLASLSDQGIVYGSFDTSSSPFTLTNPNSYSFNTDSNIQDYQVSGQSQFLQLEIISQVVQPGYLHLTTLLTVSDGQHLEFYLNFNKMDNGFQFDSIDIIGQFDKYGRQSVINWAQGLVYESTTDNFILVGHKNSFEIALGLYPLTHKTSEVGHERMIGAVESKIVNSQVNNDFAALLFRTGNEMRVVVSSNDAPNTQVFNLSKQVFLTYNYDNTPNFDTLDLVATNAYGSTSRPIIVTFEANPVPHSGLAWYIILVIVLGVLAVVGIGVFLFIKYKKKQGLSKDSLLSVSKAEDDDEEI